MYCIQPCIICRPSDSTVSEDAGIEHRTVATSAWLLLDKNLKRIVQDTRKNRFFAWYFFNRELHKKEEKKMDQL
jgi:hypothetical protein